MEINSKELKQLLVDVTVKYSGHEDRVGELHISQLWKQKEEIIAEVLNGKDVSENDHLKFYQGNMGENGLLERLYMISDDVGEMTFEEKVKISGFEGRLIGEADAVINGDVLIEVKTVPDDKALFETTRNNKVPFRVYAQVNGYLYWGKYKRAIVIYESRATGKLWTVDVLANEKLQEELANKALEILTDERVKNVLKKAEMQTVEE